MTDHALFAKLAVAELEASLRLVRYSPRLSDPPAAHNYADDFARLDSMNDGVQWEGRRA